MSGFKKTLLITSIPKYLMVVFCFIGGLCSEDPLTKATGIILCNMWIISIFSSRDLETILDKLEEGE